MKPRNSSGHRAGPLKQQNKTHKHGRHKSNRNLENINKGRQNVKSLTRKSKTDLMKVERRNQILQKRTLKRHEVLSIKRSLGVLGKPPHLVACISLSPFSDPHFFIEMVMKSDEQNIISGPNNLGHYHISFPRYKQRLTFFIPPAGDLTSAMDSVKVADTIILLNSVLDIENDYGNGDNITHTDSIKEIMQSVLLAHGMPSFINVLQGMDSVPIQKKQEIKKNYQKSLQLKFPDAKLNCLEKQQDALLLVHQIISQKKRSITFRDRRSHMLVEEYTFVANEKLPAIGTLKVSGYIRGQPLSVNSLVHISGYGTFQISQIDAPTDPNPLKLKNTENVDMLVLDEIKILEKCDPLEQQSLESENTPDPMEGEQTWPTQEELEQAEADQLKRTLKKVPKGTSDYQAAWIVDDENESANSCSESEEENDADMLKMDLCSIVSETGENSSSDESEMQDQSQAEDDDSENNDQIDVDEDKEMYEKFKEERLDQLFPDEVDTPIDKPAKTRFAKYRGLKSFNSSIWDPKENLPLDYARIFQFDNINRTRNRILKEARDGVLPGWYVTLHLMNVPKGLHDDLKNTDRTKPLVIFGLLPHEQKMSVINVVLKRHPTCLEPIKSKEKLIFHMGFRRFAVNPIFSSHTNGNKHKYERFMRTDVPVVATFFAPIIFPPSPVVVFKANIDGSQQLVATGSVLSVNPDRTVVKRVVLSGHPFKINKRSVVVRYMFFNRDDITWFKPVELTTKYGRRGHIQEPLGTHGRMKCKFDAQLKSQDVVLMNLYKRVFPKWSFDECVPRPKNIFCL